MHAQIFLGAKKMFTIAGLVLIGLVVLVATSPVLGCFFILALGLSAVLALKAVAK